MTQASDVVTAPRIVIQVTTQNYRIRPEVCFQVKYRTT
jgi:hypothetical protein